VIAAEGCGGEQSGIRGRDPFREEEEQALMEEKEGDQQVPSQKPRANGAKCLGPVGTLEEYVRPDWWQSIFNAMYLKTDGDVVDDQDITRHEVGMFAEILKLPLEDRILDLCCGQGRHCLELARRGYKQVEGLDRSHCLIQKAKRSAQKEGLHVRLREGDARKLPYPADSFDVVLILGNSFGYFETVKDDLRVLKEVFRVLKPWGKMLVDVADGRHIKENFQPRSWEWIDKNHFVCRERSLSVDGQRLISREVITHVEQGVVADQFYAERLYTRESLEELMEQAGFLECVYHATFSPESQRNQDLGMMEQRLIVTGLVRKEWTPVRKKSEPDAKRVVVVFGDPDKPDPLKPLSVFDDDDFYTIDELKSALRELDGFQFEYLDNHDTLMMDLKKLAPKTDLVLNLCDEGYGNDPRKELHIPAMLEQLGIPYTGSGPQCLAFCYDKSLVRGIASEMGIPVPRGFFIKPEDSAFELPVDFPVIVKPNFGDSSYGITQRSVCWHLEDLVNAISEIRDSFGYDKPVLLERFLTGKDLSVGIIGNPPTAYTVLPITEEDYSALPAELPRVCGYEAKWDPTSPYWEIKSIPAQLPEETEKSIEEWCLRLFDRLECRDYARFDWRLDAKGSPHLLEVNPNPGWCWDGHLAKMAKIAGMTYADMLEAILRAAQERLGIEPGNGKGGEVGSPRTRVKVQV
jgi:D-alanine-D-alanine ligase